MSKGLNYLIKELKTKGIAFSTVKDGKIVMLSKEILEKLLEECEKGGEGYVSLFVKTLHEEDIPEPC